MTTDLPDGWQTCPVCGLRYPQLSNPRGCPNEWRLIGGSWVQRPADKHDPLTRPVFTRPQRTSPLP